jgi:hypothetical protein
MGFTTSCFIRKNTPELRNRLKKLGIRPFLCDEELNAIGANIKVHNGMVAAFTCSDSLNNCDDLIDCGTNEDLFLALAALRDDTSANQYWVFDQDFLPHYKKGDFTIGHFNRCSCYCHVASVKELIEHFK